VHLVIEGIPPHTWDEAVVRDLLGSSCEIKEIAPEMASREDLASFKVMAWTDELERIPPAHTLVVPEQEVCEDDTPSPAREFSDDTRSPPLRRKISEKSVLKYKVLIHVDRVEEEPNLEDRTYAPAPGLEDIPQSGLPIPSEHGGGRSSRRLPWRFGTQDERGGGRSRGAVGRQCSYCQVAAAIPASWRLPPMGGRMHSVHVETKEHPRRNIPSEFVVHGASGLSSPMIGPTVAPARADKEMPEPISNPKMDAEQREPVGTPKELGLSQETHVAAVVVDPTLEASAAGLGPQSGANADSMEASLVSEDKTELDLVPKMQVLDKLRSPEEEFFVVSLSAQPNNDTP
jgi:hypothetical protein